MLSDSPAEARLVFVVSADPVFSDSLAALLGALGYATALFDSVAAFKKDRPRGDGKCCLILDSGDLGHAIDDLIGAQAQTDERLPAVVLIGDHDPRTPARVIAAGAAAVVLKPLQVDALTDAVKRVLGT
jgi:FixJ family two-component response regulator